jgi:hypothetical protein
MNEVYEELLIDQWLREHGVKPELVQDMILPVKRHFALQLLKDEQFAKKEYPPDFPTRDPFGYSVFDKRSKKA